ncbi:MAG: hypothetical protein V9G29_00740 [Burkholderiaceae bacterium]
MTGLSELIALRRSGLKPAAVFIDIVSSRAAIFAPIGDNGIAYLEIEASDCLASIDFRPLVGLNVAIFDNTGNDRRHRQVAALVRAVEPARLVVPIAAGGTWAVHCRHAGNPPTESKVTL